MNMHPGIQIHRIPAAGGPGLIFVIGLLIVLLVEIPAVRLVSVAGLLGGALVAGLLRLTDRTR